MPKATERLSKKAVREELDRIKHKLDCYTGITHTMLVETHKLVFKGEVCDSYSRELLIRNLMMREIAIAGEYLNV